jgi:hypothetical protein
LDRSEFKCLGNEWLGPVHPVFSQSAIG